MVSDSKKGRRHESLLESEAFAYTEIVIVNKSAGRGHERPERLSLISAYVVCFAIFPGKSSVKIKLSTKQFRIRDKEPPTPGIQFFSVSNGAPSTVSL
jgi:hypothetical protein